MNALGIDIGGSGIKGAPVSLIDGVLTSSRIRFDTPQPSKPKKVLEVIAQIIDHFGWRGPIGCTFPGVIRNGRTLSAANVHPSWVGFPAKKGDPRTTRARKSSS